MSDTADYDQLDTYIETMIDAAIELDLWQRPQNFVGNVSHGWTTAITGWSISGLSGYDREGAVASYNGATGPGGTPVGPSDDPRRYLGFDPQVDVVQHWQSAIRNAFADWHDLPDPTRFQTSHDAAVEAVNALSLTPEVTAAGSVNANADLSTAVNVLTGTAGTGETFLAFKRAYLAPLVPTMTAQWAATSRVLLAVDTEQKLWENARVDIATIADLGGKAMQKANPQRGGDWDLGSAIAAVGTLATIAGLVSGGTLAPVFGTVATVAGLLGDVVPPKPGAKVAFDAGTVSGIADQIGAAITKENDDVRAEEQSLADVLSTLYLDTYRKSDTFLLGDDSTLLEDPKARDILHLQPDVWRDVARHEMSNVIAGQFERASTKLNEALDGFAWVRNGSIGLGVDGCFSDYADLVIRLRDLADDDRWQTLEAAKSMIWAANVIDGTDDGSAAKLRRHAQQMKHVHRDVTDLPAPVVAEIVQDALPHW